MERRVRHLTGPAILASIAGLLVAGCGSSDNTTTQAQTNAGSAATGKTLEIKMGDYFFDQKNVSAKAGTTVISAPNEGSVEHELVLFKTNMNPAKLPTKSDGSVDEEKMDKVAEGAGELADVEAGKTKSGKFDLTPGKYVMFCNIPGHYAQGMYGSITVSK